MSSEVGCSPSVDIPIDPDLLELDDGRDAFDNDLGQEQSSGVDDNDEDEHVQEDEDVLVSIDTESSKRYDEDVGFK